MFDSNYWPKGKSLLLLIYLEQCITSLLNLSTFLLEIRKTKDEQLERCSLKQPIKNYFFSVCIPDKYNFNFLKESALSCLQSC